jgi:hypothetical protein
MSIQRGVLAVVCLSFALIGCPPPPGGRGGRGGGGGGAGGAGINPGACGKIDTDPVGRKLYAFLVASDELDRASIELEGTVHRACGTMATILGIPATGDTKDLCNRTAIALRDNLQVSVKTESRLVTRTVPPVCHTDVSFTADLVAQCEARASADVTVRCDGRCNGTCNGACSGTMTGGQCAGTCQGGCSGSCDGYADVDASAECKASAEVRANLKTTCTEPKVEVVRENVTVVDATQFDKAIQAINEGLPALLTASAKLELAAKALGNWVATGASLLKSSGELVAQIGQKGVCLGGQLAAVVAATANIQARFSVSIEVSAQVSASAGASGSGR